MLANLLGQGSFLSGYFGLSPNSTSPGGSDQYTLTTTGSRKAVIAVSDGLNWTLMRTGGSNSTP